MKPPARFCFPRLAYAQARIPCYLLAEPERGLLHSYMLSAQGYVEQSVMQLVRVTGLNL